MPEVETLSNTQAQELTTSDNGTNVKPVLVCDSHFFVQSSGDGSFSQQPEQKFGAISETQFRTSATISLPSSTAIYAICQGQVFIQPQAGNANKVNVILRPYRQPIKGLPVKYFIYRGLDKNDFISGTGETALVAGSETAGSGFIKHIWGEFNKFYQNENENEENDNDNQNPPPPFLAKMIGFSDGTDQQPNQLIDSFFYKIASEEQEQQNTAYELPLVPKGIHLGNAQGELSIDVVLNKGDHYIVDSIEPFKLNLAFARASVHTLDVTNGDTNYKKKLIKEACTQFIDIASFYGLHCTGMSKLYINNDENALTTKETIYAHVKNFHTSSTQYFYIQSNRQRSYNFYNNYQYSSNNANNLFIGATEDNLTETTFGDFGWPIHTTNSQTTFLKLTTDNYSNAGMFVAIGNVTTANEQNFVRNTNLLQTLSENTDATIDVNYTKPIGFTTALVDTEPITQYIHIIYEGKQMLVSEYVAPPQNGETPTEPQQFLLKDIDDMFGLINAESFIQTKTSVEEMASLLDEQLQIINFPNTQADTDIAVVKTRRITDAIKINDSENVKRVTYETLLHNIRNTNSSYTRSNSSNIAKASANTLSFSKEQNNFYQPQTPYYLETELFTHDGKTVTGLLLKTNDDSKPTQKILGITNNENSSLKNLIDAHNLNNCNVFFKKQADNDEFNQENKFTTYLLGISGENPEGNVTIYITSEELKIYTMDDYIFFSADFSKYQIIEEEDLFLDYDLFF